MLCFGPLLLSGEGGCDASTSDQAVVTERAEQRPVGPQCLALWLMATLGDDFMLNKSYHPPSVKRESNRGKLVLSIIRYLSYHFFTHITHVSELPVSYAIKLAVHPVFFCFYNYRLNCVSEGPSELQGHE